MNTQETFEMFERRVELRGERKALLRQLQRKFGPLPQDVVTRIENAEAPLLAQLEDKVLFAKSLDEMFET